MVNLSDVERSAMRKCLRAFGKAADGIGFDKPLGEYSQDEALQVIESIVTCFTQEMVEYHEQAKYPPVRGMAPTPDPMADPFADLEELPWESKP